MSAESDVNKRSGSINCDINSLGGGSPALNPRKAPTAMLSITNMMTAGRELRQELPDLSSTSTHSEAACVSLLR